MSKGDRLNAIGEFQKTIEVRADMPEAYNDLGAALVEGGQLSRLRPPSWAGADPAEIGSCLFWPAPPLAV